MAQPPFAVVLRHLRQLLGAEAVGDWTDAQALEEFAQRRTEAAFTTLVERYGPLVLGLCRRVLRNDHDAEDAFQATFLVLARRAGSIRKQASVGSWLYGVAYRIAQKAKVRAARRRASQAEPPPVSAALDGLAQESQSVTQPGDIPDRTTLEKDPAADLTRREMGAILDEELHRLPEKYRSPLVLCYLEQRTHEEAAQRLGWPRGSFAKRLARALELLGERLSSRGVALSAGALTMSLAASARAAVPSVLEHTTVQAAVQFAVSGTAAGAISSEAVSLANEFLSTTMTARIRVAAVLIACLGLAGGGAAVLAGHAWTAKAPGGDSVVLDDGGLADRVDEQVDQWQPTHAERRIDDIGWARDLRDALELAKQHDRPIVLFSLGGRIGTGRSLGSAAMIRASALSNNKVIDLLNRSFVPVCICNQDYVTAGSAPAEEKAQLRRLRKELAEAQLTDHHNQVCVLSSQGRPLATLDTGNAARTRQLLAYLKPFVPEGRADASAPLIAPAPQSLRPPTGPDAVVLHLTSRYLERKGDAYAIPFVELGLSDNYHNKGIPAENWIVLERDQWSGLLSKDKVRVGSTWDVDPRVAAVLFRHMYPPSEENDIRLNRIDAGTLRATAVAATGGVVRARLDGTLKMKHPYLTEEDDNNFVTATLMGYVDFEPARPALRSLRLVTTSGTYARSDFGIALRLVP